MPGWRLPPLAPTAAAPPLLIAVNPARPPATYTPQAQLLAALLPIPSQTATLEPTPTLRPTASPSPSPTAAPSRPPPSPTAVSYEDPPLATECAGRGAIFRGRFPSGVAGPLRDYSAYLPPCYQRHGRAYPVLYLIHGSIQTDSHWLDLGLAAVADQGLAAGRYPPFIAIMPDSGRLGNMTSGGPASIEGVTVNDLLPFVEQNFCAWPAAAGRSIGGISRGGYWALEIAFSHTDLFGAVSGHSSHLRFETDPARYNPLATYAAFDLSRLRIWLDRGESDFLRHGQDQLHASLDAAGIGHHYFVNPGGHSDDYWAAHLGEYLDWHLSAWPLDPAAYPACA
ncbi:MAG: alpha/beta hydrolase [Candidatus Promineifilaceae bacterium]